MPSTLVLVRHGESEWNRLNLFTGWKDPDLTERGVAEARRAGQQLKRAGLMFHAGFTSQLKRAQRTLELILAEIGQPDLAVTRDEALNERDYGDLAGLNKDEARERWGAEQVHLWRRSYDVAPPGGESLKDTAARTLPYFERAIRPLVREGRAVIVAAHGNSLRSIIMRLEALGPDEIVAREVATGVPIVYDLDPEGRVASKRELT